MNTNKAESLNPTALLKVRINDRSIGQPDFYSAGGHSVKTEFGQEVSFDWYQTQISSHRDKNGYLIVEFYLHDFDVEYFNENQPLVRPDWSILTTLELEQIYYEIGFLVNGEEEHIMPEDTKILDFRIFVKEEPGDIAYYRFTDEQIEAYEKKVK